MGVWLYTMPLFLIETFLATKNSKTRYGINTDLPPLILSIIVMAVVLNFYLNMHSFEKLFVSLMIDIMISIMN